ncbi:MAG: DMT family transporter [Sphingomonadales bacterium]
MGLLLALLGFGTLAGGDALVKTMAGEWPGTAIAALRYVYGTSILAAFMVRRYGWKGVGVRRYDLQFLRGAAVSVWSVCFFLSVQLMPLATATSIQFSSPIWVALLSPLLLRERATRAALLCTLLALTGVLIVLRPNLLVLGPAALLPVLAALGMAGLVIFNRKAAGTGGVMRMQFWIAAMATPLLIAAATIGHFSGMPQLHVPIPTGAVLLKCLVLAVSGTVAHWLIYVATQRASAPLVAPMAYVQLIIAAALGGLLFSQGIDPLSGLGMGIIVVAGLLLWRSQGRVHRRKPEPMKSH